MFLNRSPTYASVSLFLLTVLSSFASGASQQICPSATATADPGTIDQRYAGTVFDIYSPDGVEAWSVEDGARIRHRTSAGVWSFQPTPKEVQDTLHRVHFLSNVLTGWAVGESGWILKTTTGGATWSV
jgi:photosystem II stability/assembly factor-like uncharacterized protein